jgi:hypothetical protein
MGFSLEQSLRESKEKAPADPAAGASISKTLGRQRQPAAAAFCGDTLTASLP